MVTIHAIGGRFSSRLWKNHRLWRIRELFQDTANAMATSIQVIWSRPFHSLHAETCDRHYNSSGMSLQSTESPRQLFLNRAIAGVLDSFMNHTSTQYYSSHLLKYIHSQARCGLMPDILLTNRSHNIVINSSTNCKIRTCNSSIFSKCIHSQAHHGLRIDTVPASHSDDGNTTSHQQTRSAPLDIEELVEFLQDENASDICVIQVPPHLDYVNYFVVCSGFGGRHLRRMADGLVTEMKSMRVGRSNRRVRVEGEDCEDWMAVDMGTIVVHFMTEEARSKYELEKLWALGPIYDDQYRSMKHILENNP